jgi:hypothetical protein
MYQAAFYDRSTYTYHLRDDERGWIDFTSWRNKGGTVMIFRFGSLGMYRNDRPNNFREPIAVILVLIFNKNRSNAFDGIVSKCWLNNRYW